MKSILLKITFLITGLQCFQFEARSQYSYGLDLSGRIFFQQDAFPKCIGARFYYLRKNFFLHSALGFGFSSPFKNNITAYANDPNYSPPFVNLSYESKANLTYCELGIGKVFGHDFEDGGVVGLASAEFMGLTYTHKLTEYYDKNNYSLNESFFNQKQRFYGLNAKLGLGYLHWVGDFGIMIFAKFGGGFASASQSLGFGEIGFNFTYLMF